MEWTWRKHRKSRYLESDKGKRRFERYVILENRHHPGKSKRFMMSGEFAMQRIIGGILVIAATSGIGFLYSKELQIYLEKMLYIRHLIYLLRGIRILCRTDRRSIRKDSTAGETTIQKTGF